LDIQIALHGEIVERQELLNGTRTVAFDGTSPDGAWSGSGVVSWNLGLVDYAGEGDLTLVRQDGAELYATLLSAVLAPSEADEEGDLLTVEYEIDGSEGPIDAIGWRLRGTIRIAADEFESELVLQQLQDMT
jgi:hypothetical protein